MTVWGVFCVIVKLAENDNGSIPKRKGRPAAARPLSVAPVAPRWVTAMVVNFPVSPISKVAGSSCDRRMAGRNNGILHRSGVYD
jgi:hypothetical protein